MAASNTRSSASTKSEKNKVQVSFTLDKDLKKAIAEAADRHGRTQSEQFAQSVKDGVTLQELIKKVSDHLTRKMTVTGGLEIEYKPNDDTCLAYIISAVEQVIKQEREEQLEDR